MQPEPLAPHPPRPKPPVQIPVVIVVAIGVLVVLGMVVLWPTGETKARIEADREATGETDFEALGVPSDFFAAEVVLVEEGPCEVVPEVTCRKVAFELQAGPDTGTVYTQEFTVVGATTPDFSVGETVVLSYLAEAPEGFQYQFADRQRRSLLRWLLIGFAVAVIVLGRWRGVGALGGLAASLLVLFVFVLPAIVDGRSPVLVAIVGAAAIAYLALYIAHGFSLLTTVALLGTLGALALTALLSAFVTSAANFSGLAAEESIFLTFIPGQTIDVEGLILAGIVLGALGAIDDVTVTQSSAVWELKATSPGMEPPALFTSGIRIGRDHIASTVNTLALAYAGASLPLLLLFVLASQSLGTVANSEVVAIEVVRTLVGSIGLVAAVPITTWLAAIFAREREEAG